jgi:hypothetical protein
MVRSLVSWAVLAILLGGCISVHETQRVRDEPARATYTETVEVKTPAQVLRHVVLIRFEEGTSAADIRKVENAFNALASRIDAIYDYEGGTNVSVDQRNQGYTHCFVLTFLSEADRDRYQVHPAHQDLVEMATPHLAEILVIDFWAK